ncbi:hypothetical protein FLONG3_10571 [Fusarium longipes]|uniref:DUF6546 domain-containing protein n=1 Tax=Fusarium longipes TaxID=694270 RepID=A0A395RMI7_9HYPO|nr:hypothetical protein FLONG3_10571 [Fusarium longipes]
MSTSAIITQPTTSGPKLPLDIQLYILKWIIKTNKADTRLTPFTKLSTFTTVSKTWQNVVERELFRSLTVTLSDLDKFAVYSAKRRHPVKHILLEIWICPRYFSETEIDYSKVCFTEATETLLRILSTWSDCRLTLEFGVLSREDSVTPKTCPEGYHVHSGSNLPRKRLPTAHLRIFECLDADLQEPSWAEWLDLSGETDENAWVELASNLLGYTPLALNVKSLEAGPGTQLLPRLPAANSSGALELPRVSCATRLVVRRRYCSNIDPNSFAIILSSLPSLESFHVERWCYGYLTDELYDQKFHESFNLPPSVNDFSFYEECGTKFHQRYITHSAMGPTPAMRPRSNPKLLAAFAEAADRIEHIAVSFAFDACSFFEPELVYKKLKTLALTSKTMISQTDNSIDELLYSAAKAAKLMPRLETLEIWYCRSGTAGIFTYCRLGLYNSCVSLKRTGDLRDFRMSTDTEAAWQRVVDDEVAQVSVDYTILSSGQLSPGAVYAHLELKERILHHVSRKEVACGLITGT